ncbi:MAG TPA: hypothetical protein VIJ12_00735 [Candidatus Baltobacteraceae bacterium]
MKVVAWRSLLAGAIALVVTWIVSHGRSTPYDNYVLLAQSFLSGHVWVYAPSPVIDALPYGMHSYIIEAPLPAILMMPSVAIWGAAANQTFLAIVLCGIGIGAAFELCKRYGTSNATAAWLCAFLLAGTDLLWCAMLGDVWFVAHVSAVCFTLLALVELAGKRRGWLVALWAACAVESRFSYVLALPAYAFLLATIDARDRAFVLDARWRGRLAGFAAVLVPVAALWVWYNVARWGAWYDIGYSAWYHQDSAGSPTGSPFQLQYLSYQLHSFFWQGPQRVAQFPWVMPTFSGIALTWTSPALVLALLARRPARVTIALWIAALLCAAPDFVYYVNGFSQFGMRHALDFEPFLFGLMILGARERIPAWAYVLLGYSILVGLWGCWIWNTFVRQTY